MVQEFKERKVKVLRYYEARVYIVKLNQDPIWINKIRKINVLIIYYKALGQVHKFKREMKVNVRKEIRIECEGVGPFKEIELKLQIN